MELIEGGLYCRLHRYRLVEKFRNSPSMDFQFTGRYLGRCCIWCEYSHLIHTNTVLMALPYSSLKTIPGEDCCSTLRAFFADYLQCHSLCSELEKSYGAAAPRMPQADLLGKYKYLMVTSLACNHKCNHLQINQRSSMQAIVSTCLLARNPLSACLCLAGS